MFHTPGVFFQVPDGVDDPDLIGADAFDLFEGMVVRVAVPEGYYEFVDEGEDGGDGLPDGIIELGSVAYHSKSADGHRSLFKIGEDGYLQQYKQTTCRVVLPD
jgi:hypothetical protein